MAHVYTARARGRHSRTVTPKRQTTVLVRKYPVSPLTIIAFYEGVGSFEMGSRCSKYRNETSVQTVTNFYLSRVYFLWMLFVKF